MPTRRNQPPDPPGRPRLRKSREEAAQLLEARVDLGEEIAKRIDPGAYLPSSLSSLEEEVSRWSSYNRQLLRALFDTDEVADGYDRFIGVA